ETFMTMVRWRLTQEGQHNSTFGYITKGKRRELSIEKSHHNDAFVIAGGRTQPRVTRPLMLEQIRRNKRSMEQFYDAKYRDLRDGKTRSGSELSSGRRTRNINLNGENLRQHRAHKVSAGRRSIKKKRYPYKQHDLVLFEGTIYEVIGMQNLGAGVKLKNYPGVKNKVVKPSVVKPIRKRGGLCEVV
ncbi:MAG: hypothetical protein RID53_31015, partial [Coleofasciculus sp. B1-GNL1-01]